MSTRLKTSKDKIVLTVFILLVCVIYGLPHIIMSAKLGKNYTPFSLSPNSPIASDETYGYAGFANYIYRGHILLKDAYVYEYRNFPTPLIADNIPAIAYALLAKISGSLEKAYIISDFISPPILFVMIYLFTKMFIKNNYFAIATAFIIVIARDFVSVIPYPQATFKYITFADYQNSLLYLSRGPHPQFSFIIFLASIWSLFNLTDQNKTKHILISGILSGLLFYTFMFYFSYFSLLFVIMIIFYVARRNFDIVRRLVLFGLVVAAIASYYFYNVIKFYSLSIAQDFTEKMSLPYLYLNPTLLRYVAILIFFYISARKKDVKFYNLCLVILVGIIIIPIFKLIIGRDPTTFHFVRFALMPFATVAFFVALFNLFFYKSQRLVIYISVILISVGMYLGFKTQIIATKNITQYHKINSERQEVFNWLNMNTSANDVVGSLDDDFNFLTSVYTRNWVYFPYSSRTIMPTYEGATRYILLSNLLGISAEKQKSNLEEKLSYIFRYRVYNQDNHYDFNSPQRIWLDEEIDRLSYSGTWQTLLRKFQLNYIVISPQELSRTNPNPLFLKPIESINGYLIFKTI